MSKSRQDKKNEPSTLGQAIQYAQGRSLMDLKTYKRGDLAFKLESIKLIFGNGRFPDGDKEVLWPVIILDQYPKTVAASEDYLSRVDDYQRCLDLKLVTAKRLKLFERDVQKYRK